MGKRGLRLITLAAIPVLVLSACSSTASSSESPAASVAASAGVSAAASVSTGTPGTVRWFVGLGAGSDPAQLDAEKAFVNSYNKSNKDGITIKLDIENNKTATDTLKVQLASGNGPDIIGPVGVKGRNGFEGLFLDLTQEIAKNNYDTKVFPDALVKFFNQGGDGQVGLPYDIYPGYIWYNKDSFAKAGLPNLPTKVGEQYQGKTWDWNELGTIAAQLTLDSAGKKSTDAGFDKTKIVKYGIDFQWCDGRRTASLFGGGNFVDTDGKTAVIPAAWSDAFNWYYDAMWKYHYAPTATAENSTLLGQGSPMGTGNVAMNASWAWSISSLYDAKASTSKVKSWDMGVVPSWKGSTSSPLDADTFTIAKASKNPDAAFKAMVAIEADASLMQDYGGTPALASTRATTLATEDATLAPIFSGIKVTWSVLDEMVKYPATPSHEANMPAFIQSGNDYTAFYTKLQSKEGLDVNAELTSLQKTLQADFTASVPITN
jgi:multiple sugar transport system substrate-binding protein